MKPLVPLLNPYLDLRLALTSHSDALQLELRKKLIWAYAWAVPTNEAIHRVAQFSPIIELGAGTGYWAWLITQAGSKIRALDQTPEQPPRWTEIHKGGPADIAAASERSLLFCWPPLNEAMADHALSVFRGDNVVYVGEWRGRTANKDFHDRLEREWKQKEVIALPSWPGFNDQVYIYSK